MPTKDESGSTDLSAMHHQPLIGALWEQTVIPDKEYLQQVGVLR